MFCATVLLATLFAGTLATSCWRSTTCTGPLQASFPGPWESYMYSPGSRVTQPKFIFPYLDSQQASIYDSNVSILLSSDPRTTVVLDFGIEIGGVIGLSYGINGSDSVTLGLAFTEAKDYIGVTSDSSRGGSGGRPGDGPLLSPLTSNGTTYVMPDEKLRGGFRYLTLFLNSTAAGSALAITNITLEVSFQPTWQNLRAYQGYFHSSEDILNKVWYSGAFTVQTNSIAGNTGQNPLSNTARGWRNNGVITSGPTVIVDGAKRDRFVWTGDMGVAVPSAFVGTGDLDSTKYALMAIYDNQRSDGMFPKAAPPYVVWDSDTYHMWTMIGTYNYLLYSGDVDLVTKWWPKYEAAVNYTSTLLASEGVVAVKGMKDWGRLTFGDKRCSASMLLYRALTTGAEMASWLSHLESWNSSISESLDEKAANLRKAILEQFWNEDVGAFSDSPHNTTLFPQDANSMALAFGVLAPGTVEADRVSDYLISIWTDIGPSCPELPNNVSPFISGIELEAHYRAGRPDRALMLTRSLWGWYLDQENGTQSTTPEGFLVDGTWAYRYNNGYSNGPAYMSHAHSWSSGPTSTLTEYMVGLRVTSPAGKTWQLQPASFGELAAAQAGFTTRLGKFQASFHVEKCKVIVEWDTPDDTEGWLLLPGVAPELVAGGKGSRILPLPKARRGQR